jgi:hypothetical protein
VIEPEEGVPEGFRVWVWADMRNDIMTRCVWRRYAWDEAARYFHYRLHGLAQTYDFQGGEDGQCLT